MTRGGTGPGRPGGRGTEGEPGDSGPGDPPVVRRVMTVYGWLLAVLPAGVRAHREEMSAVFRRLAMDAHARGGARAVLSLLLFEIGDVAGTAVRSRAGAGGRAVGQLGRDVRLAARRLRRSPAFTATAVLSLGLVIGGNAAIFSVVNAVLLKEAPQADPDELVEVYFQQEGFAFGPLSYPDYRDLRDESDHLFEGLATSRYSYAPWERSGEVRVLMAELVSGNYFAVQGLQPAAGRLLTADDDVGEGAHPVVVLGHPFWQRAFDGEPGVVGTSLQLGGRDYTVVGVAPRKYPGMIRGIVPDLYVPASMTNELLAMGFDALESRQSYSNFVRGRLRPGVTAADAERALATFTGAMRARYPDAWADDNDVQVVPTSDVVVNPTLDRFVTGAGVALVALVVLVLLVASANLASFLLARGADRRRDVAVRLALGAGRSSLIRQQLTEALLLALLGGALGAGLAAWATRLLMAVELPLPVPITLDLSPDARVVAWTAGVTVLAGILLGMAPALQATRTAVAPTLRDESPGGGGRRRAGLRQALVVGQVAVSMACLVAAGLFVRNLEGTEAIDPGFGDAPAALVSVVVPPDRYDTLSGPVFLRELAGHVRTEAGVEAVGFTSNVHLDQTNTNWTEITVPGVPPPEGRESHRVDFALVDPGFFEAMGIPLVRGRAFDEGDVRGSGQVAIVSEAMARRFWPGEDAVGRTFLDTDGEDVRVVGVAADTKVRTLGEGPRPFLYAPLTQAYSSILTLVARTRGPAEARLETLVRAARRVEPDLQILKTTTLERHLAILLLPARLAVFAFGAFAALALILALTGLYGLVSYSVAGRTREVGIRLSLGAEPGRVVRSLVRSGLVPVGVGCAAGLLLGAGVGLGLRSLLFHVDALDPVTFVLVPAAFLGVATVATWIPARRAARVDPYEALRGD